MVLSSSTASTASPQLLTIMLIAFCSSSPIIAFQTASTTVSSKQLKNNRYCSNSQLFLSAEAYDYRQPRPFTTPLDQSSIGTRTRATTTTSTTSNNRLTTAIIENDDDVIDYLPWFVLQQLQPQAKRIIAQATRQHVFGDTRNDPKVNMTDVLAVIRHEFKSTDALPVVMGGVVYNDDNDSDNDGNHNNEQQQKDENQLSQILSFAAHHRLPKEITVHLLDGDNGNMTTNYKHKFLETDGWNNVLFPKGLAVRLPRFDRYVPIIRRHNRRQAADLAVREAATVVMAPPRRLLSREAFLQSLAKEMATPKKLVSNKQLPFFPKRLPTTKLQLFAGKQQQQRLTQSIRAAVLSLGILSFSWYNLSLLWHWQRLSPTAYAVLLTTTTRSFHRIGAVMKSSMAVSALPLLTVLALSLAPVVHRLLSLRNDGENPNRTFLIVASCLAIAHVGIGTSIFFLDAAIMRSLVS